MRDPESEGDRMTVQRALVALAIAAGPAAARLPPDGETQLMSKLR